MSSSNNERQAFNQCKPLLSPNYAHRYSTRHNRCLLGHPVACIL